MLPCAFTLYELLLCSATKETQDTYSHCPCTSTEIKTLSVIAKSPTPHLMLGGNYILPIVFSFFFILTLLTVPVSKAGPLAGKQ